MLDTGTSNIYEEGFVLSNVVLVKPVLFQSAFVDVGYVPFATSIAILKFYVILGYFSMI